MSWNFQMNKAQRLPPIMGASGTEYTDPLPITHLDSVHGVFFRLIGTRYGGAVTIQLQQATSGAIDAVWADVGSSYTWGSGGTGGSPSATDLTTLSYPAANTTFMPVLRLKITTAAATGATFTSIQRSIRGLK